MTKRELNVLEEMFLEHTLLFTLCFALLCMFCGYTLAVFIAGIK